MLVESSAFVVICIGEVLSLQIFCFKSISRMFVLSTSDLNYSVVACLSEQ